MENYFEKLKDVTLFDKINCEQIQTLLNSLSLKHKSYCADDSVFLAGDRTQYAGIVLSGKVYIVSEDFYGNRNILDAVESGGLFGEVFAFTDTDFLPVSVFAAERTDILLIDFKKIADSNIIDAKLEQKLIYNMLRIMAKRNLMLNQKIQVISKRTTKEKLLAYLSTQASKANSNSFEIPFNRQELADYLSVDRSAMSAELCKLRDQGLLNFKKNKFVLIKN